jgi:protein-tyrosine-phosphatase
MYTKSRPGNTGSIKRFGIESHTIATVTSPETILFVCTGNTCRSPMAEAIVQHLVDEGLLGDLDRWFIASAGTAARSGQSPSPEAAAALKGYGLSIDGRSKTLTADMIAGARVVLCMTEQHVAAAMALVQEGLEHHAKIMLLDPGGPIEDPMGMGQEAYDVLAKRFMKLLPQRLKEVLVHEDRAGIGSSRRSGDQPAD